MYAPEIEDVKKARNKLSKVIAHTPLQENLNLSEKYQSKIYLKREDLQVVRSYKIRGAYNKLISLDEKHLSQGVVCASAGNHAQGVALSCKKLGVKGMIFMPAPTPKQKVQQVSMFGKDMVEIILTGDTFDDAYQAAREYCNENNSTFVHPFDDEKVIEGQATVALELFTDADFSIDYLFVPIGGGGLSAGMASVLHKLSPETKIIGVEPEGAPAMLESIKKGKVVTLDKIDKFVDGAAVKRVGELTFPISKAHMHEISLVNEGKLCSSLINMYNESGIILEPAGALSVAVLDQYAEQIKGKNVVCVLSGSNNDITRTEEIRERSILYEGLKHYFIIRFPQRAGALKEFVVDVLGPTDDIVHFEYTKKNSREKGSAVVGIELKERKDLGPLIKRMKDQNFLGEYLNENPDLFNKMV
ncbi:MAG: threonine ammonia-lyase IlvA [Cyclobacteriaceae bacterium]